MTIPQVDITDVVLYIKPNHLQNILDGKKNHDFRKYCLPKTIKQLWFFKNTPINAITCWATTQPAKTVGTLHDPMGLGNDDFDKDLKVSKFAYLLIHVYQPLNPPDIDTLKNKYNFIPPSSHFNAPKWLLYDFT
jgi:hypothetical protein